VHIREESEIDRAAVLQVHREAFNRDAEAALVERLRADRFPQLSLVAEIDSVVVGHVLFSEAQLVFESEEKTIGALGPVAVLQSHRRRGVAESLIRHGLRLCWQRPWPAVIVLGNPAYYGRFGFSRADAWSIRCEFDVPSEAFMIVFSAHAISGPAAARYAPAFASV
jgi:putative acetyltransferase